MLVFFWLLTVLHLWVENWRNERRGSPDTDSRFGSGDARRFLLMLELVWGAATNWRATFNKGTLVAGADIYIQGNRQWGHVASLFSFN